MQTTWRRPTSRQRWFTIARPSSLHGRPGRPCSSLARSTSSWGKRTLPSPAGGELTRVASPPNRSKSESGWAYPRQTASEYYGVVRHCGNGGITMWNQLLQFLGLNDAPACRVAREAFGRLRPTWVNCGARVIKREVGRRVVAVFYQEPDVLVRPRRYKLFSVSNDLSSVEELPCNPNSPYWIKGRR